MANPVELVSLFKNVSPRIAKSLIGVQKIERSVASLAQVSQAMGKSDIGRMLSGLAKAGGKLAGKNGVVTFTAQQASKNSEDTILRVVITKGKEVVAKMAGTISSKGNKIGGNIAGASFHYAENIVSNAEKFRLLAKKLGVDLGTATARYQTANSAGIFARDEKTMTDIILGKLKPAPVKGMFKPETPHTKYDPKSMDKYFESKYSHLNRREMREAPDDDVVSYNWDTWFGAYTVG